MILRHVLIAILTMHVLPSATCFLLALDQAATLPSVEEIKLLCGNEPLRVSLLNELPICTSIF